MGLFDFFKKKIVAEITRSDEELIEDFTTLITNIGAKIEIPESVRALISTKYGDGKIREVSDGIMKAEIDYKPKMTEATLVRALSMPSINLLQAWDSIGNYVITFTKGDLENNDKASTINVFSHINAVLNAIDNARMDTVILIVEKYNFTLKSLRDTLKEIDWKPDAEMAYRTVEFFDMILADIQKQQVKKIDNVKLNFTENLEVLKEMNRREEERESFLVEKSTDELIADLHRTMDSLTQVDERWDNILNNEPCQHNLSDIKYPVPYDGVVPDSAILIGQGSKEAFKIDRIQNHLLYAEEVTLMDGTTGILYTAEVLNKDTGKREIRSNFRPIV